MTDIDRSYPKDLARRVRASWPKEVPPLPGRLDELLDASYHASFLRDEERPVTFRILVLPCSELGTDSGPPAALMPLLLSAPRSFDEHELRRLSPAAEAHRALIGVDDSPRGLVIWGLVQSGPRWLQAAQGGRAKEPPMPLCAVVRVMQPGQLVVACANRLIAELRGGRLSDFTLDVFQSRWLPELFSQARARMASEYVSLAGHARAMLSEEAAGALTGYVAQQMVKRVIATMRGAHHGGALVIVPPDCVAETYLQLKYTLRETESRRRFRGLMLRILELVSERARATGREGDVNLYRADTDARLAELDEGLFEMSHLMAQLADIDGAVVVTRRFEVLGFGGEIAGNLPAVREVRRALDLEGETFVTEVVDSVGTRHRSAYRLCAAVPGAVAIVVSQDGGVRFVTRHRDAVTYWDHGAADG